MAVQKTQVTWHKHAHGHAHTHVSAPSLAFLLLLPPLGLLFHASPPDRQVHLETDHDDKPLGELPDAPQLQRMAPPRRYGVLKADASSRRAGVGRWTWHRQGGLPDLGQLRGHEERRLDLDVDVVRRELRLQAL